MKRIIMCAFAVLLVTAAVQAQSDTTNTPHRWHQGGQRGEGMKELNLTADQQAKLKTMRKDFKQKADAIKAQKLTDQERNTQMQALREQQRTQMESIFTPEQKAQWEKMRTDHQSHMNGGRRRNGDSTSAQNGRNWKGRDGANLQKELNLTADQQAKVTQIRSNFRNKTQALHNDQTLTQDQKRTQFKALMQQQQEQLKTVLTKEQQDKWQQLRKERREQASK